MGMIPSNVSGAELAALVESEARRRGQSPADFASALSRWPGKWLAQLRIAETPKAATIARVQALFDGAEVPPPPPNNFQKNGPPSAPATLVRPGPSAVGLPRVLDSAPCVRCGVRPDVSCRHRPGVGEPPVRFEVADHRRDPRPDASYNFHRRKAV